MPCTYGELENQLNVLQEAIDDDVKKVDLYHYPPEKSEAIRSVYSTWNATLGAFPSVGEEIIDAMDCYAVGHNTACVFHLMRIAEHGLRALSRSLAVEFPKTGTPIEWAQWQDLIDQIRSKGKQEAERLPKGTARDAARDFYSGAVHHFEGFKEKYRNAVMHVRRRYDELDALRAINQVRDFMNGLSFKVGEKTTKPVKKWP